ncbi:hypothetical protein B0T16DRAFT_191050 [Cercophora newfieldiana]|uniref:Uncharacterized protein n=1 Tax=Cercophora newfieldiana TaxID=92897 RepID=A0AA39Y0V5_9PEZI|nr:hypothetical protein B0T16DRAFT_191050 [Cercophora newfieldiana]
MKAPTAKRPVTIRRNAGVQDSTLAGLPVGTHSLHATELWLHGHRLTDTPRRKLLRPERRRCQRQRQMSRPALVPHPFARHLAHHFGLRVITYCQTQQSPDQVRQSHVENRACGIRGAGFDWVSRFRKVESQSRLLPNEPVGGKRCIRLCSAAKVPPSGGLGLGNQFRPLTAKHPSTTNKQPYLHRPVASFASVKPSTPALPRPHLPDFTTARETPPERIHNATNIALQNTTPCATLTNPARMFVARTPQPRPDAR